MYAWTLINEFELDAEQRRSSEADRQPTSEALQGAPSRALVVLFKEGGCGRLCFRGSTGTWCPWPKIGSPFESALVVQPCYHDMISVDMYVIALASN